MNINEIYGGEKLLRALKSDTGQSIRCQNIVRSLWNGPLCDDLAGLDDDLSNALQVLIILRAKAGGDADDAIRPFFEAIP